MRLLKAALGRPEFHDFYGDDTPLYAILSHTWGSDEVTYQEALQYDHDRLASKGGYQKIDKTRAVAALHGFEWVWIDTCCIDKTSSAELSEAINSMYRWYQEAAICYAYLSDMLTVDPNALWKSRWFTRGWTLQELIAPSVVIFFNKVWQEIGTKAVLSRQIRRITRIPEEVLVGVEEPESACVAQRMSWASRRQTSRLEDMAYCLMGLFGVNMPMLYGEGERAFVRLQEEIIKISNDQSLFAWSTIATDGKFSLLATSPSNFDSARSIVPKEPFDHPVGEVALNSRGIWLDVDVVFFDKTLEDYYQHMSDALVIFPHCQSFQHGLEYNVAGIYVASVPGTTDFFSRTSSLFEYLDAGDLEQYTRRRMRICLYQERQPRSRKLQLARVVQQGDEGIFRLLIESGVRPDFESLNVAARNGHVEMVKMLLDAGSDCNQGDKGDNTPLLQAIRCGHSAIVQLLLARGARESRDRTGAGPVLLAAKVGHGAIVEMLVDAGMDFLSADKDDVTPLFEAVQNNHATIVQFLLARGAGHDDRGWLGRGPVFIAARLNHEAIVKMLLDAGVDYTTGDDDGKTPLSAARRNGHSGIVQLLLSKAAKDGLKEEVPKTSEESGPERTTP